ncbi:MAG TPA: hypothetical protein VIS96_04660 [Terrimicrobiaceae bacterium]
MASADEADNLMQAIQAIDTWIANKPPSEAASFGGLAPQPGARPAASVAGGTTPQPTATNEKQRPTVQAEPGQFKPGHLKPSPRVAKNRALHYPRHGEDEFRFIQRSLRRACLSQNRLPTGAVRHRVLGSFNGQEAF